MNKILNYKVKNKMKNLMNPKNFFKQFLAFQENDNSLMYIKPLSYKNNLKKIEMIKNEFYLDKCVYCIPHKKKKDKGGEDAHLEFQNLLVIADGVGSWNRYGIDPKEYALALCNKIKEIYVDNNFHNIQNDATDLIIQASNKIREKGSSTCCLIMLDPEKKKITTSYMGDSLYMILRYSQEEKKFMNIFKSEDQSHRFNQPYQLGSQGDDPKKAIKNSHDVEDKDIIILASDGLWDNLKDKTIIKIINENHTDGIIKMNNNNIAEKIAKKAEIKSIDINYDSPFSIKAKENGLLHIKGGKQDDITVIICQILNYEESYIKSQTTFSIDNIKIPFLV